MIRLTTLEDINQYAETLNKQDLVKMLDKSKISTDDMQEYIKFKTKNTSVCTNDRKTLCRLITKYIKK